jgi:hypothetical protein
MKSDLCFDLVILMGFLLAVPKSKSRKCSLLYREWLQL